MLNIHLAQAHQAPEISELIGELLAEIMQAINETAFSFHLEEAQQRLHEFIREGKNIVFVAERNNALIGFVTIYPSFALYAEGAFATLAELYVKPEYRAQGVGKALLDAVKTHGKQQGWKRLEVTTPPLPQFDKTLAFYQREGFQISGGRKLKTELT
ncbi:GNAT family N-acetyltransferase [Thiomicrorhabdus heinhorstiae]|uniref:GNAT family N-acetyltransferase n=1 Tax=Thiomicrorhabdus heinhorstiae TaxID=2748010 RepID=A0ABS0BUT2_9GAMM|nr:GNAT family N-acetyltransferase [Thiomicrorhabdus heinhorstiae]MBF6057084.1 GNAT family N-acetyltransferase [Thiomicrorhabdus heinhorstiae]